MAGGRNSGSGLGAIVIIIIAGVAITKLKDYWPYILGGAALLLLLIVIGKKQSAKRPIVYIGNRGTKTYHKKSCQTLESIGSGNMIGFHSSEEARRAGYRPCNICKPQ